jgi:DNA-binding transcriptional ArsR family regulator
LSNHLAKLRDAGLVHATRHEANGRFLYYERDEAACAAALRAIGEILS